MPEAKYQTHYNEARRHWVVADQQRGSLALPPFSDEMVALDLAEAMNLGAERRAERDRNAAG